MAVGLRALAEHFADLEDPRRELHQLHPLLDLIALTICAVIAGADSWAAVERFGQAKQAWLKTFLRLPHGIPSHDTIGRVFALLQPAAFQACFRTWMAETCAALGVTQVAIDGKVMHGSGTAGRSCLHVVSAFASDLGLTLGQQVVADKSNEITAIPALLRVLDLTGAVVSIDAMGCQTAIAQAIRDQAADYLLAVKENQPTLFDALARHVWQGMPTGFAGVPHDRADTQERSHGRDEQRTCYVFAAADVLTDLARWPDVASVVVVLGQRTVGDVATHQPRYYLSSKQASAAWFLQAVRQHWGIENGLHWVLDVVFGDDASRVREGHGPTNFALLRRLALGILKQGGGKGSLQGQRQMAGWDHGYLERILRHFLRI